MEPGFQGVLRKEEIVVVVPETGQPILKWMNGGEGCLYVITVSLA